MSESAKAFAAVIGAIAIGFILVGLSKEQTVEEKENAAMVRSYFNLITMATDICPKAIKKETGVEVYNHTSLDTDKETIMTLKWEGLDPKKDGFGSASCKIETVKGGITELIIDGKTILKR
ncbi:MAG: hypothetical protein FJ190_03470 [Gammaproteobacteria bacterium]|nr:hypothetical protein [Gammaproteobacteria bacterium]